MRISILLSALSSCSALVYAQTDASQEEQAVLTNPDVKHVAIIGMVQACMTETSFSIDNIQVLALEEAQLLTSFQSLRKRLELSPISQYSSRIITSAVDRLPSTPITIHMSP
jgi:non-ribosomal peptide synthetase component E (peptide arylation enzyme)